MKMNKRQSPQDFIQMVTQFKEKHPEYRNFTPKALALVVPEVKKEIVKNSSHRNTK